MTRARRSLALLVVLAASASAPACAQVARSGRPAPATLWAGLIQSRGYVVGAPLMSSGLQRQDGDTTWTHVGWNTPRVVGIAYDPTDPRTMYLASGNGVLRTRDGGASWRVTNGWRITEVRDVAVDARAPRHVYLASGYGVWRSTDGADSWTEANDGLPPPGRRYTETIEADRTREGRVLVGTQDGVFASADGARSWQRVGGPGLEILDLQQSRADPGLWAAGAFRGGLLLSRDDGRTWVPGPDLLRGRTLHAVALDPTDARRMAAVGWGSGVVVSADGGRTWTRRGDDLPTEHFYEAVFDANVPGRLWVATLEEGVFRSDDLGRTWAPAGLYGTLVFDMLYVYPAAR